VQGDVDTRGGLNSLFVERTTDCRRPLLPLFILKPVSIHTAGTFIWTAQIAAPPMASAGRDQKVNGRRRKAGSWQIRQWFDIDSVVLGEMGDAAALYARSESERARAAGWLTVYIVLGAVITEESQQQ